MTAGPGRGAGLSAFVVALVALTAPAGAQAYQVTWNEACPDITLSEDVISVFDPDDTFDLTPNVLAHQTGDDITNGENQTKYSGPTGTYSGSLDCTITSNGVSVPASRAISLTVTAPDPTHRRHRFDLAAGTVTVPLGGGASVVVTMDEKIDGGADQTSDVFLFVPNTLSDILLRMPPLPATTAATGVDTASATLTGTVDPRNLDALVHFAWGPAGGDLSNVTPTQTVPAGGSPVAVSAPIAGLTPGTAYSYRLVASNSVGAAPAVATSDFTTATPPAPPAESAPAATTPASAPAPPAPPVTPAALVASKVLSLPSAKRCLSRRDFPIHIRLPAGVRAASAQISVNGTRRKELTGAALTKQIDLRGLPKGRVTVRIVVRTTDGRSVSQARAYRTCVARKTKG